MKQKMLTSVTSADTCPDTVSVWLGTVAVSKNPNTALSGPAGPVIFVHVTTAPDAGWVTVTPAMTAMAAISARVLRRMDPPRAPCDQDRPYRVREGQAPCDGIALPDRRQRFVWFASSGRMAGWHGSVTVWRWTPTSR